MTDNIYPVESESPPSYPYVTCYCHPGLQKSYVVCNHVFRDHAPVAYVEPATDKESGAILCAACRQRADELTPDDLRPSCEPCAREQGLLNPS